MRKVLYRAAIVLALAAAAVTGVTTAAGAAPAHHTQAIGHFTNPAPVPADWWW